MSIDVHSMLFYHTRYVITKQEKAKHYEQEKDEDEDEGEGEDEDEGEGEDESEGEGCYDFRNSSCQHDDDSYIYVFVLSQAVTLFCCKNFECTNITSLL